MFTVKFIYTDTNEIIEEKQFETFKEVTIVLSNVNKHLMEQLDKDKSISVFYNDVNLFSYSESKLMYDLDFNDLVHKIDFSLLNFSDLSLILQEFILNKNNINTILDKYNNLKIPNMVLIKFNDGTSYSVDDLIVDDLHISIKNRKVVVDLMSKEKGIKQLSSFSLEDIDEIVFTEFNFYCMFELTYNNKEFLSSL